MNLDLKTINEFRKEFMKSYYKEWKQEDLDRVLNQPQVKLLTMEWKDQNDMLVALTTIHFVESLTRKSLIIEDFIVDKMCRNMGFGTQLLQRVIDLAKEIKADCVEVCTPQNAEVAKLLYEKFGFKNRKNITYRLWLKY